MTLNEYVKGLNEFLENSPQYGELEVITASDDAGGFTYYPVYFAPSVGVYDSSEREFDQENINTTIFNAVCVN